MNLVSTTISIAIMATGSFLIMSNYQRDATNINNKASQWAFELAFEKAIKQLPPPAEPNQCSELDDSFAATLPANTTWTATIESSSCTTATLSIELADGQETSWPLSLEYPYSMQTPSYKKLEGSQHTCDGYICEGNSCDSARWNNSEACE